MARDRQAAGETTANENPMNLPFRSVLSSILLFAAVLPAQTVTVRGELGDGRATGCYYCPGSRYVIKWSETQIDSTSTNINLALYLNQQLMLTGTLGGTAARPSIDVTAVVVVTESFSFAGQGRIGNRFRATAKASPGDLAVNLFALNAGFASAGGALSLLLDPMATVVLGVGAVDGNGEFKSDANIPNVPSLVGLHVFGQALIVPQANGAPYTSNPDSKVVQA